MEGRRGATAVARAVGQLGVGVDGGWSGGWGEKGFSHWGGLPRNADGGGIARRGSDGGTARGGPPGITRAESSVLDVFGLGLGGYGRMTQLRDSFCRRLYQYQIQKTANGSGQAPEVWRVATMQRTMVRSQQPPSVGAAAPAASTKERISLGKKLTIATQRLLINPCLVGATAFVGGHYR